MALQPGENAPEGVVQEVLRNVKPAEHDELVLGALQAGGASRY